MGDAAVYWFGTAIVGFLGVVSLLLPKAFVGKDGPDHIRLSIIGVVVFAFHTLFSFFPLGFQLWAVRGMGIVCLGIAGFMGWIAMNSGGNYSSGKMAWTGLASKPAENIKSPLEDAKFVERMRTEGPAYTQKVKEFIAAGNPGWHVAIEEPLIIEMVDKATLVSVVWDVTGDLYEGNSPEAVAKEILASGDRDFAEEKEELSAEGALDAAIAENRQKYGFLAAEADGLLAEASALYQSGKKQEAVAKAQRARAIRAAHLGDKHEKTKQVDAMIAAASAQ